MRNQEVSAAMAVTTDFLHLVVQLRYGAGPAAACSAGAATPRAAKRRLAPAGTRMAILSDYS